MLPEELIRLIKDIKSTASEDNRIELKKAEGGCPKLYDTLSSFSNQHGGGIIVFGIDQDNDFDLCGVYDADDLQKKIASMCRQMTPIVRPVCTAASIDGRTFVSAEIHEIEITDKPCYYTGAGIMRGSYIRVGDSDEHMTEYEIYSFEAFRKKLQDELRTEQRADISDIQTLSFEKYMLNIREKKPVQANFSIEKILKLQGFTDNNKPTLAGIMMFAEYPQAFFPQLCITAVSIPGYEIGDPGEYSQRFNDNERIEGTIPQMLDEALSFIKRNMRVRTIVNPMTGKREDMTEYPVIALREILLNALIHRDYSIHTELTPITIRIFTDRIEVENPGGLYGRITIDDLGKSIADTRNPFIAKAMEITGEAENRFYGIPIIRRSMQDNKLPPPVFENYRGVFKVTLYNHMSEEQQPMNALEERILDFCKEWRSRAELRERFEQFTASYLMSYHVNPLVREGKLELLYPQTPKSKNQKYRAIIRRP